MTFPIYLDQLKLALKFLPLADDVKNSLIKNTEILIEYRTFLSKKYNITESDSESKIREYMTQNFNSGNLDEVVEVAYKYVWKVRRV